MSSRDVNELKEPFRSSIKELIKKAKRSGIPAFVTDTTRTLAEQKKLVKEGKSKTLKSKHLIGEAADIAFLVNGKLSYDAKLYKRLYTITKTIPFVIWPYRDLRWKWDKLHHEYDPSKEPKFELIKQVNSLFRSVWGRQPAPGESNYFQARIVHGNVEKERDLIDKMRYWKSIVYPNGRYSLVGDIRWQYEKIKWKLKKYGG